MSGVPCDVVIHGCFAQYLNQVEHISPNIYHFLIVIILKILSSSLLKFTAQNC
jgi:hypothetical protein